MADTLKFVDSIAASPTTRLDLNDDTTWSLSIDGTDFSPPPLNRAVASSLLVNGATYPASAYGNRTLRLRLELKASTVDLAAAQIQLLAIELDRPTNILMWKPGTTDPVFFRTFRAGMGAITELPGSGTYKIFDVEIMAEPFALAPVVTLTDVVLDQDGTTAEHAFDISSVDGDVETPITVSIKSSNLLPFTPMMFAISRRSTHTNVPFLELGSAMNVSSPSVDGVITGSTVVVNFNTDTSLTPRARFAMAATDDAIIRGRYRIFLRVGQNGSTSHQVQVGTTYGIGVTGDILTTDSSDTELMLDMGDWSIPGGPDPVQLGDTGTDISALLTPFYIYASQVTGTGDLTIRYVLMIPVDDQSAVVYFRAVPSGTEYYVWDGPRETWYTRTAAGSVRQGAPVSSAGASQLRISPGVVNRFHLLASTVGSPQSIGPVTVGVSYQPRYLYVR